MNGKVIFLPTDTGAKNLDLVDVKINKVELYNLEDNDGTFNGKTIELPEVKVLENLNIFETVNNGFFTERDVFVNYSADQSFIVPSINLSSLPVLESEGSNFLINNSFAEISKSFQPIEYLLIRISQLK